MEQAWIKRTEEDYRSSDWSGGRTTELAIFPPGAAYARRDFLWRVSSATVELEESEFTALPDYWRLIATLEGEITLRHNGGAPLLLRPLKVHGFDGAWATHSSGRCRDFNLMLRKGRAEGEMELLSQEEKRTLPADPRGGEQLLFCVRGRCRVESGEDRAGLQPGESLLTGADRPLLLIPEARGTALMRCRVRGGET